MEHIDVTVIGAGVVGLAAAARLSTPGRSVYVLERHRSFGQETSSRNSEVIHAGIYYPEGSLKALLCVQGNRMLYDICSKAGIPHKRTGKLIVAVNNEEERLLEGLLENGRANGAPGLEIISASKIKELEPHIKAGSAIYSPSTGIIDTHALMQYFVNVIKDNGGDIVYDSDVGSVAKKGERYEVTISEGSEKSFNFISRVVINSAGLESDNVSRSAGIDPEGHGYSLKYCKGQYFRLSDPRQCRMIKRLIYPVPRHRSAGLGVHATPDLAGGVRLGPDARYIDRDDADYSVNGSDKEEFYRSAGAFLPFLDRDSLIPDTAGIRPKLQGPDDDFRDFVIKDEKEAGFPGFINLIGIESPGLTCAPAIAEHIANLLQPYLWGHA